MQFKTKTAKTDLERKLVAGIQKHLEGALVLAGKSYTPEQLVALLQLRLDAAGAVAPAKAAYLDMLAAEAKANEDTKVVFDALKATLLAMFGTTQNVLADFGLTPRKRSRVDAATNVVKAQKAKATRAARHTMGPKKKLSVTGQVLAANPPPEPTPAPSVSSRNDVAPNGATTLPK